MTADCIFCRIIAGEIPADYLYQDEEVVAFRDINPLTPTHLLVIPRKHIPSLVEMSEEDGSVIGQMTMVANQLAKEQGIADRGYRLVVNCGPEGGQLVPHLHMHVLGGRELSWNY